MARYAADLTKGSVFKKFVFFALPLLLANLLNQLYHSADVMVVGKFAQDSQISLAAVGSTGAISALLLNLFFGLGMGGNVVCSNLYGAKKYDELRKATQTDLIIGLVSGVFIGAVGFLLAEPLLKMMGSPEEVLPFAVQYMKIIFLGVPGNTMYVFCAAILRAHGDTKRPMYILTVSGILNVVLNLIFVICFHLDSAGVAWATIISQYLSAAMVLYCLFHDKDEYQLVLSEFRFSKQYFLEIARIGIPGGLNGMVFSISNATVATAINSLGPLVVAAKSAAESITSIIYQVVGTVYVASTSFVGQNFGAKNFPRIKKTAGAALIVVMAGLFLITVFPIVFPEFFLGIFTKDALVVETAKPFLFIVGGLYFLYGFSEVPLGCSRGMGKSVVPTIFNASVICLPRLLWVAFIFPLNPTFLFLILCYPISWILCAIAQWACFIVYFKKEKKKYEASLLQE